MSDNRAPKIEQDRLVSETYHREESERIRGGRVFEKPSTFETMKATQPLANPMNYRIGLYGLDVDGHQGWGHTGFWNTFAFHFPELDITVAGSVNKQQGPNGSRLAEAVIRAVLAAGKD